MKIFECELTREDMNNEIKIGNTVVGFVTKCNKELECLVDLGNNVKGTCSPEEIEVLLGNKEKTKRVASLDRVGKYAYFKIIDKKEDGYILSRKAVQEDYYKRYILNNEFKTIFRGRVLRVLKYGLFIDIGYGLTGILSCDNFTHVKMSNPQETLKDLKEVKVFIREIDGYKISLGHKELLGDFNEQIKEFEVGGTYVGTVRSTNEYGIFVELNSNLTGLADKNDSVRTGDIVSVYIKNIDYNGKKVKLRVVSVLEHKEPYYRNLNFKYLDMDTIPRDWEF